MEELILNRGKVIGNLTRPDLALNKIGKLLWSCSAKINVVNRITKTWNGRTIETSRQYVFAMLSDCPCLSTLPFVICPNLCSILF